MRTYSTKIFEITQRKATTGWYDFSEVKLSKMLHFFSVAEAKGLIYSRSSGENFSFACYSPNIFSAISAFDVYTFQLSLVSSFPCLHCDSISALPKQTLGPTFHGHTKYSYRTFSMTSKVRTYSTTIF